MLTWSFVDTKSWLVFADWVYDMQGLIAGIIAATAAFITIVIIRMQIKQQDSHRDEDLKTKHYVDKINAIWWLMEISEYAETCQKYIYGVQKEFPKDTLILPVFPKSALENISKLVAGLNLVSAKKIQDYVGHTQVQYSRLNSIYQSVTGNLRMLDGTPIQDMHALETAKKDYYVLKYQTNGILGYCRGDFQDIPDLMDADSFRLESRFNPGFLSENDVDFIANAWPRNGWWQIRTE